MPGSPTNASAVLLDQRKILRTVARRRWLVLCVVLLVTALATAYGATRPASYAATAQIQVGVSPSSVLLDLPSSSVDVRTAQATTVSILQSPALYLVVQSKVGGRVGSLTARAVPDSQIVDLSVVAETPERATEVVTTYVTEYLAFLTRRNTSGLDQLQKRLQGEVSAANADLQKLDDQVAATPLSGRDEVVAAQASRREALKLQQTRAGVSLARVRTALLNPEVGARLATPPLSDYQPLERALSTYVLLGVLLGAALALGLVLLLETRDDRLHELADVEARSDGRYLGAVLDRSGSWAVVEDPHGSTAGAWRSVLAQLGHGGGRGPLLVVPAGGGSPSRAAAELAAALAEAETPVVLCDLGGTSPSAAETVGAADTPGLLQVVGRSHDVRHALQSVPRAGSLRLLASGTPGSARDVLTGVALDRVLADLSAGGDAVVLCGPELPTAGS